MRTLTKIIFIITLALIPAAASAFVGISADKTDYLPYEAIYLTMELDEAAITEGFRWGALEDMNAEVTLFITPPDGDEFFYRPPMRVEGAFEEVNTVEHATLILHGGKVITAATGPYRLIVRDSNGIPVSNELWLNVNEPENPADSKAVKRIAAHAREYGMFVYLGGGDHITNGAAIAKELADGDSSFRPNARAVVASNYSQVYYDWKEKKVKRAPDLEKVMEYMPEADDYRVCDAVKLRQLQLLEKKFKSKEFKAEFLLKKKAYHDHLKKSRTGKSRAFRELEKGAKS